jgi:hypothetical protein
MDMDVITIGPGIRNILLRAKVHTVRVSSGPLSYHSTIIVPFDVHNSGPPFTLTQGDSGIQPVSVLCFASVPCVYSPLPSTYATFGESFPFLVLPRSDSSGDSRVERGVGV